MMQPIRPHRHTARTLLLASLLAAVPAGLVAAPAAAQTAAHAAAAPADPASAAIDRAAQAFRSAHTVHATFEQTLSNAATGTTNTTTGELSLAQPNKIALRFNNAGGDRVVVDGRYAWIYLPTAVPGQVLKVPARGKGVSGVESVSEMLASPRSKYAVSDGGAATVDGRATRVVVLTPKADGQPVTKARVWVDDQDGAVRQIELTDANGLVRTLRMTSWTLNAKLPPATFTFDVPAGARVVDRTAYSGR